MKRIIILIIIAFSLAGTGEVFADHHKNNRGHLEHTDRNRDHHRNDRPHRQHATKDHKKKHNNFVNRPGQNIRKNHHSPNRELEKMIRYATRGSRDVKVWRINSDTFIVRYYRNGRHYIQKLYPYSGRYGAPGVINIHWSPESFWTPIPSININIPLN